MRSALYFEGAAQTAGRRLALRARGFDQIECPMQEREGPSMVIWRYRRERRRAMTAKIIEAGENISLVPVVDSWELSDEQAVNYPRIADFIALGSITDIAMLRAFLADLFPNIADGEVKILPGGFCLMSENGEPLIEPQCCCDFQNLNNWALFIGLESGAEWTRVWLGHPQTDGRREGENVWLACDNDRDTYPVQPMENHPIVSVPIAALAKALDAADETMKQIEARFDQALAGVLYEPLRAAAIDLMLKGENGRYDALRALERQSMEASGAQTDAGQTADQRNP
jgi:hypothetical protein